MTLEGFTFFESTLLYLQTLPPEVNLLLFFMFILACKPFHSSNLFKIAVGSMAPRELNPFLLPPFLSAFCQQCHLCYNDTCNHRPHECELFTFFSSNTAPEVKGLFDLFSLQNRPIKNPPHYFPKHLFVNELQRILIHEVILCNERLVLM